MLRTGKSLGTESRLAVARGWGEKWGERVPVVMGFLLGVMKCSKVGRDDHCCITVNTI